MKTLTLFTHIHTPNTHTKYVIPELLKFRENGEIIHKMRDINLQSHENQFQTIRASVMQ